MPYTIGIIGAARRLQGTGPYIARSFSQHGHYIAGIVGTSEASAHQAKSELCKNFAIETSAYNSFESLIAEHPLDIVVISSPPSTHLEYLQKALNHRCHVFCEKPLWWPATDNCLFTLEDYLTEINNLLTSAKNNRCLIHLNTQWPYTLKDFYRLYPHARQVDPISQFAMYLCPQSKNANMLVDAASHGLSMLYQLVGEGELKNIRVSKNATKAIIDFDYCHSQGDIDTTLGFLQSNETPKPASYQINGLTVNRTVSLPEYQIKLQSNNQTLAIQDPLDASIEDFLAGIEAQLETDTAALKQGAVHLYQLIEHFII